MFLGRIFAFERVIILPEFTFISSKDNPLIKFICSLQSSSKARKESRKYVLEGLRICTDACDNGVKFDKLIVSENAWIKYTQKIELLMQNANECVKIPDNLFAKISDTDNPQGIIAVADIKEEKADISNFGRYVALENLQDPSNLGAISRTAEALGVNGLIVSGGCDIYSPKVLRASMGTLLRMAIYETDDIINFCHTNNLKSFSCVVDGNANDINNVGFCNGCAIIIGNEANGISERTKANSDERITIKMTGNAESLNAASAASIAIWEMMKNV